jgi:hypothetical protein
VIQFLRAWVLEAEDLTTLRIHTGHDVLDRAVFTGSVHSLKDKKSGVAVVCIQKTLQGVQPLTVLFEKMLVFLPGSEQGFNVGRPLVKFD